jgi:glutathione S-transferase
MIKLYGTPLSRARRNLWLLEELGLEYSLVRVAPRDLSSQTPEYKALNPMSKVPTLVDGDLTLTESLAINLYLARRYGKSWWPQSVEDEARLLQWTFFGATELDPLFFILILERLLKPEDKRIEAAAEQAEQMLARPLTLLNKQLADRDYIHGKEFTLSDLNVSAICTMGRRVNFDYSLYPHMHAWLQRCWSRPAFKKADTMT